MQSCTAPAASPSSVHITNLLRNPRALAHVHAGLEGLLALSAGLDSPSPSQDLRRAQFTDVLERRDQIQDLIDNVHSVDQTALQIHSASSEPA